MIDERFMLTPAEVDLLALGTMDEVDESLVHVRDKYKLSIEMIGAESNVLIGVIDTDEVYLEVRPINLKENKYQICNEYGSNYTVDPTDLRYVDLLTKIKVMFLVYFENMATQIQTLLQMTQESDNAQ